MLSSGIEGMRATLGELLALEAGAAVERSPADLCEVGNYAMALEYGVQRLASLPILLATYAAALDPIYSSAILSTSEKKLPVPARGETTMERPLNRLLYWTPRVLCILYAVFISIFAADVFGEGRGFWQTAFALLTHLIPTFLVVAVLAVSWRREWIGGALFIALGVLWVVWAWRRPFFGWTSFLLIAGPLLLTGVLFLLNWRHRAELRGGS